MAEPVSIIHVTSVCMRRTYATSAGDVGHEWNTSSVWSEPPAPSPAGSHDTRVPNGVNSPRASASTSARRGT